jgi:hypothetical protein
MKPNTGVAPARIFNVDLSVATLPSPPLTKNFKFPGTERGVIPAGVSLPRIIAMWHDEAGYKAAAQVIRSLPKKSRIGLECDHGAILTKEAREFYAKNDFSFSQLRVLAEKLGHQVIILEPIAANFSLARRIEGERISELVSISQKSKKGSPEWIAAVGERLQILNLRNLKELGVRPIKSAWRSTLMARKIARTPEWKSTDAVFMGSAHAINLAHIFDVKVDSFIGNYDSPKDLESQLSSVMLGQESLDLELQGARARQRLLYKVFSPFKYHKFYSAKKSEA